MAGFSLLSIAFYAYFGLGSVAVGYLLLRLSYPEVRTMDFNQRLGVSALSGLLLAAAAFAIDYSYDASEVMARQGFFPLVLFLLFLAAFAVLKIYFVLSQSQFLTVGIPLTTPMPAPQPARAPKPAARPPVPPLQPQARPLTAPSTPLEPMQLDFGKLERKPLEAAKPKAPPQPPQQAAKPAAPPHPPAPVQPAPHPSPIQTPSPIVPRQPAPAAPPEKPAPHPSPSPQARQGGELPEEKKRLILKLRNEEAYAEPKPSFFSSMFGFLSPKKPAARPAAPPAKPEIPKSILRPAPPSPAPYWERRESGPSVEVLHPPEKPTEAPKKETTAAPEKPAGPPKPGYLAAISQVVDEKRKEPLSEIPMPQPEVETVRLQQSKPEGEHVIMTYRGPINVASPASPERAPPSPEDMEAMEIAQDLAPSMTEDKPAAKRQMVRRLYMSPAGESDVSVIADRSVAQTKEFDSLVSDVYTQLKENQRSTGIRSALSVNQPPKPAEKQRQRKGEEEPRPELTFDDLVKGGPAAQPAEKPPEVASIFARLRSMNAPAAPEPASKIAFVKVEAEKSMGCPTCHSKNSRIIFCPYCGSGMCANCSPKIRPTPEQIVYSCPKCGEEVSVKKKQ
ncbi:MAG: hypothetical protein V1787_04565 [Candidatus Micrarchaeota archaeon]